MYNKSQLSRDLKAAKEPKRLAKPKDIDYVSKMGYRDDSPFNDRPYIDIFTPNGTIDMSATGIPLIANGQYLPPYSGIHQFDTDTVREMRLAEDGGEYMDLYENEIAAYRAGGYVVEELPKAQVGYASAPPPRPITDLPEITVKPKSLGHLVDKRPEYAKGYYDPWGVPDNTLENIVEIFEPTGLSSWDDVVRAKREFGPNSWQYGLEMLGAIPLVGKASKTLKALKYVPMTARQRRSFNTTVNLLKGAGYTGRASDVYQAYDEGLKRNGGVYSQDIPYPPKHNPANSFAVNDPRSMQNAGTIGGDRWTSNGVGTSSMHNMEYTFDERYDIKYKPIYLSDPNDPRIGRYSPAGNAYRYKAPVVKTPPVSLSFVPPTTIPDLEFEPPIEPEAQWTNPDPWNDVEPGKKYPKAYLPNYRTGVWSATGRVNPEEAVKQLRTINLVDEYGDAYKSFKDGGTQYMQPGGTSAKIPNRYNWDLLNITKTVEKEINKLPQSDPRRMEYDMMLADYNAEQDDYKKKMKEYEIQNRLYQYSQLPAEAKLYGPYNPFVEQYPKFREETYNKLQNYDLESDLATQKYYSPQKDVFEISGANAGDLYTNLLNNYTRNGEYIEKFDYPQNEVVRRDNVNWQDDGSEINNLYNDFSKYPNFANKFQVYRSPGSYEGVFYTGDRNSAGNAFILQKPSTRQIENNYNYEEIKKIFPNLTNADIDENYKSLSQTSVPFRSRWYYDQTPDPQIYYENISLNPSSSLVRDNTRVYAPDTVDETYDAYTSFFPMFNEPEKVAEPLLQKPNTIYEEEEPVYNTSKVYDPDSNTWKDVIVERGSTEDVINQSREAWRQKNIEAQKANNTYRDRESSHDPSNINPVIPKDKDLKSKRRKLKTLKVKETFKKGGQYNIGDEVDEDTYNYLKSIGYEFE